MLNVLAAISWTILIVIASLMHNDGVSKLIWFNIYGLDKFVHGFIYMIFVLLWSCALAKRGNRIGAARLAFYISLGLGLLLEILQGTTFIGRSFEMLDIVSNIMGSILGLILFYKYL